MDIANFIRGTSQEIFFTIASDCQRACFNENDNIPNLECVKNCTFKQAQLIRVLD
jgi:hypothetical protein